ncbi:MucR family transcriptional regulator [Mesorhizobium sp. L2C066B000]|uniref:MucR family transcriptional regulator n=1 Tax=Mesorhizobium sp. L2C066B000 TaxID=1287105 RepID=UPI0032AEDE52
MPVAGLPDLIASVHTSLSNLASGKIAPPAEPKAPAVNPRKSVFPDYIISLEDGRKFRSMKRHLGLLGMTPDDYRTKWNLPHDYPMVAPNYSKSDPH